MVLFTEVQRIEDGEHVFAVYDCKAAPGADLVAALAGTIRELYVDVEHLRDLLRAAINDAGAIVDPAPINDAIQRTLAAAIPEGGTHPIAQFDVARNELAEALACIALMNVHGTVIPASRIRNKEVAGQPSRGRDLLGLEDNPLTAIVGEVKASSETSSPPSVVGDGESSLASQVLGFLAVDDALLAELNWALKHAAPEHRILLTRAMLAHINRDLPICAVPVLVRPIDKRGLHDFGTFRDDPARFQPARIRFLILTIEGTLENLATAVYETARR